MFIQKLPPEGSDVLKRCSASKAEISGLYRRFVLYLRLPKERWPEIKIAEKDDDEGNKMMAKLGVEFDKTYRQFAATALDLHD